MVCAGALSGAELETVTLRLKWWPQFQFAGYYAAQAEGYYAEEGLKVRIEPGTPGRSSVNVVLAGEADYGVGDSDLVRFYLNGKPLVACAAIFQHSPYVIMSRSDRGIQRPSDLVGKKVMLAEGQGMAQFAGMLASEGIDPDRVEIVPHNWHLEDLVEGRVDAIAAYATDEPARLSARGIETHLLRGSDYGVDFYGDVLFTRQSVVEEHPARTAAFIRASLKGWKFAMKNPGKVADVILSVDGVKQRGITRDMLLDEAREMGPYIQPDFIELGHMNPSRWQQIAAVFEQTGMVSADKSLHAFLFDPRATGDSELPVWALRGLGIAAVIWIVILIWNLVMRRMVNQRTRQLAEEVSHSARIEESLRASEKRFRRMFEGAATGIAILGADGYFLQANPSYCTTTGYTEAELQRMTIAGLIHVGDQVKQAEIFQDLVKGTRDNIVTDIRCLNKTGAVVWKRASVALIRTEEGAPLSFILVAEDVTARVEAERELLRVNRAQQMLSGCNEALVRAVSEEKLLAAIARIAVESGGYRMAWVGYAESDAGKTIRPVSIAGVEEGYFSEISVSWDESLPTGRGPAGLTIRGGAAVVCQNIETDDRFARWRETALRHGYRSVICLPLRNQERTYGLLGLHASEAVEIGSDEINLLQQLADDLAFGIEALRAREERTKTLDAVLMVARGVSTAIGAEFYDRLTQSMVSALGADVGVIGRLNPDDSGEIRTLALVVDGQRQENVSYQMQGGPCATIAPDQPCIIPLNVQGTFPDCGLLAAFQAHAYIGHPLLDAEGKMIGLMAVLYRQPVARTEFIISTLQIFASRVSAELARQQVDQRVREQAALLDKAQDAIILRDLDNRITYWNKSAERLYGWSAAEATGRSIPELLYRDPHEFHEATRATIAKGEWVGELSQVSKADVEIIAECHWTLVRDEDGKPRAVLAINTDITDKKRIEHQFLRAQRMESIGTLAGGIAHDLNNVLSPVMMSVDLLKFDETDPRKLALLESIYTSARRGADMVGQVLSFARGMDGNRVEVCPDQIIQHVVKIVTDTFPKGIVIESRVEDGLRSLIGDGTQIHQVLINLCVNARDAMPNGGTLTLTAKNVEVDEQFASLHDDARSGNYICIDVSDTGMGITSRNLSKIFDPFYTTKEQGKGTGLGLSTSLAIVKGHGGFIQVYSEASRGTRFAVYLPVGRPAGDEALKLPALDLPRGRGETVLVIDDEEPIRLIACKILEAFGYRVIQASDGAEGISLYAGHRQEIALIMTDMMMPVMDGEAAIHAMKKIDPAVRIIAASGITLNGKIPKAAALGVKHFLPKPFSAEVLLRTVKAALN